ncbi:MAG: Ig-like domain-containing protein, partial [Myxococcota bacterium]
PMDMELTDPYGNLIQDFETALVFRDRRDGAPLGDIDCDGGWAYGKISCNVYPLRAGEDVQIEALLNLPDRDLSVISSAFDILPGEAAKGELMTDTSDAGINTADQSRNFTLYLTDAYGNPVEIPISGEEAPIFRRGGEEILCSIESGALGRASYACVIRTAGEDQIIDVMVEGVGPIDSVPFTVVNGVLDSATISGVPDTIIAGETVSVTVSVMDRWGNPYRDGVTMRLSDSYSEVTEDFEVFETGFQSLSMLFTTVVPDNMLTVTADGTERGRSRVFEVDHGPLAGFDVVTSRAWAPSDGTVEVALTATDAYGNLYDDFDGRVTLQSRRDLGDAIVIDDIDEVALFAFDTPGVDDRLQAVFGEVTGESAFIDVIDEDCAAPPIVTLKSDGAVERTVCLSESLGETDALPFNVDGSEDASGDALTRWHYRTGPDRYVRGDVDGWSQRWESEGGFTVEAIGVDADGCASRDTVRVYVSVDDGDVAGPIDVVIEDDALNANTTTTSGETDLTITAKDCNGNPAADAKVQVRADIGRLASASTSLKTSGSGLGITLNEKGIGQLSWIVGEQPYGDAGRVTVGRPDGAAFGDVVATIADDAVAPYVTGLSPVGQFDGSFQTINVWFSEPLNEETVTADAVSVLDPNGLEQDSRRLLDKDVLTITLDALGRGDDGSWTLELGSSLTDVDGNRLTPPGALLPAAFSLDFGEVALRTADVTSCLLSVDTFRPDGDDGNGKEADDVILTVKADTSNTLWRVDIVDDEGEPVRTDFVTMDTTTEAIVWDGRDRTGRVVENGTYTLTTTTLDAAWNADGDDCVARVTVANRIP